MSKYKYQRYNSYSKGHQAETALRWFRRSGIDVRSMRQQHLACLFSCLEALNTIMLFFDDVGIFSFVYFVNVNIVILAIFPPF